MSDPDTTPLHAIVETLPGWGQALVVVVIIAALLVGGTLFVAYAIRTDRAERARRMSRTHDHTLRQLDRSADTHAGRRYPR